MERTPVPDHQGAEELRSAAAEPLPLPVAKGERGSWL